LGGGGGDDDDDDRDESERVNGIFKSTNDRAAQNRSG
jgi:hypothetical protein